MPDFVRDRTLATGPMLTKILFTALVIGVVWMIYRNRGRPQPPKRAAPRQQVRANPIGRFAAYGFVVVLLLVSGVIYYFHWRDAHTIVTIRVIDGGSDQVTVYKAYRKEIKGNRFETLDGRSVVLGEAERVEFIDGEP